ncbi:unnamed protein product [Phytomonas sp. EM1]|nr:unnamed protein product [Phytomonas sp. EM1]|eukprot:CCW65254.1 unnamed protein product [Phytomonas sp. isolate EM1]
MTSSAINALIREYFVLHYPAVAKAFKKDSALIDEAKREQVFKQSSLEALIRNTNLKRKRADDASNIHASPLHGIKGTPPKMASRVESKRAPISDSSDEEALITTTTSKKVPKNGPVEDTESAFNARRQEPNNNGARSGPSNRMGDGSYRRFQRIDPTKVEFYDDALRDNRPGSEHMVLRQNQEMMRVKGKNFNKLKQKNKGRFYGEGVDFSVRSYQFPDSDED